MMLSGASGYNDAAQRRVDLQVDTLVGNGLSVHNKGCACMREQKGRTMKAVPSQFPLQPAVIGLLCW